MILEKRRFFLNLTPDSILFVSYDDYFCAGFFFFLTKSNTKVIPALVRHNTAAQLSNFFSVESELNTEELISNIKPYKVIHYHFNVSI